MQAERPRDISYTGDAIRVVLRPMGCMRIGGAIFMAVWLCGWAVGESFAVNLLLAFSGLDFRIPSIVAQIPKFPTATPSVIPIVFLLLWTTFWTWGGIGSIGYLLLLLFGSDTFEIAPSHWSRVRSYGLVEFTKRFDRGEGWSAEISRKAQNLVARRGNKKREISSLGTVPERRWIANEIVRIFGPPRVGDLPENYEMQQLPDGVRVRSTRASVLGCAAFAFLFGPAGLATWIFYAKRSDVRLGEGTFIYGIFSFLMLLLILWSMLARQYWIARRDLFVDHLEILWYHRVKEFRAGTFSVEVTKDSDGDETFTLYVVDNIGKKGRVYSSMYEPEDVVIFARFLEKHTGWPLEIADGIVSS